MSTTPLYPDLQPPPENELLVNESSALPPIQQPTVKPPEEVASAFTDVLAAPVRGVEKAIRSVYKLADFVTGDALPNWDHNFTGESKTTAGSIVENTAEFLTGFIPVFGQLGKVGTIGNFARGLIAGAAADFTVFDGQSERLSNLVQSHPALANPVTEFLQANPDDNEVVGRLKNAIEGAGLGALADGLVAGLRGLSKAGAVKAAGGTAEEVNKALVSGIQDKQSLQKILDEAGKPLSSDAILKAPAAKEEIKRIARGSWENGQIDVVTHVDSPDSAVALVKERAAYITETWGKRPVEPIEKTFERATQTLSGYTGRSEEAVVSALRGQAQSLQEATSHALAVSQLVKASTDDVLKWSRLVASGDKSNTTVLQSLAAQERLATFLSISNGFGTLQGRALNARKFIKAAQINSKAVASQLIEQFGGTGYLSKQLEKLAVLDSAEGVSKAVAGQVTLGGRLLRAHNEYWINAILSGPKTGIVNGLGNVFATLYLPLEGAVGAAVGGDMATARAFTKQYAFLADSVKESASLAWKAFKEGDSILLPKSKVSDVVGSGALDAGYISNNPALASQGLGKELQGVFSGDSVGSHLFNFLGEVTRLPSRLLTGTDELFKQINYRSAAKTKLWYEARRMGLEGVDAAKYVTDSMEGIVLKSGEAYSEAGLYRQAIAEAEAKGLQGDYANQFVENFVKERFDPTKSALAQFGQVSDYARSFAQEATFTRDLGDIGKRLQALTANHPMLQLVVPFVKTPTNLLKFVGQRTFAFTKLPGGIDLPILSKIHARHLAEMTSKDALVRSQAMGRSAMGLTLFSAAGMATLQGNITGRGPENPDEKAALMATGWQPYSFVFSGEDGKKTYVSYQRLDPFATFFGLIADWTQLSARQDAHTTEPLQAVMNSAISALTANVTNKSYLTGISQVLDALNQPERFGGRYLRKQLSSYIPNAVAQIKGDLDGDPALKEVRTYQDALLGKLPWLQGNLEPKRNLLGESIDSALAETPLSPINPFTRSAQKNDPVLDEVARLQHGFRPPSPSYGNQINLLELRSEKGQSAYDRWLQLHGEVKVGNRSLRDALTRLFASPYYKRLPDQAAAGDFRSPRVAEVERVLGLYRRVAFQQVQQEYPELKSQLRTYRENQIALRRGAAAKQIEALVQQ